MDAIPRSNEKRDFYIKYDITNRIPTLEDIKKVKEEDREKKKIPEGYKMEFSFPKLCPSKPDYTLFNNISYKEDLSRRSIKRDYSVCFLSVCTSFVLGLLIGVIITGYSQPLLKPNIARKIVENYNKTRELTRTLNSLKNDEENGAFRSVSFAVPETHKYKNDIYPKSLTDDMKEILKDNKESHRKHTISEINNTFIVTDHTVLYENIFWGPEIENSMPQGYGQDTADLWERYISQSEVVRMEPGCGRMQNRLVIFKDGVQACVRYRQNTDQIQGEIFSFYVARLLNLTNLAPSVVKVVDLKDKLWANVVPEIATAQWNSNRAVILTQYIPSLESATIPDIFKPSTRHLNKQDIYQMSVKETEENKRILLNKLKNAKNKPKEVENFDHIDIELNKKTVKLFVELAQWSDLIIFDYLTANLDRIVNNLFNFQWNINIMDGPAHNLARKMDSGLLLFLDNESGLLHGYRLLKKYSVYHSLMLDNLCVFRKSTVQALQGLYQGQNVGAKLSDMFHEKNNAVIRDILPQLPEKNAKILHDRIGKVLAQIEKCEHNFSNR